MSKINQLLQFFTNFRNNKFVIHYKKVDNKTHITNITDNSVVNVSYDTNCISLKITNVPNIKCFFSS